MSRVVLLLPVFLLLALLFVALPAHAEEEEKDWRIGAKTEHVVVLYERREVARLFAQFYRTRANIGSRAFTEEEKQKIRFLARRQLRRCGRFMENSWRVQVEEMGLEKPAGLRRAENGNWYLYVYIHDFGTDSKHGAVTRDDSSLHINARDLFLKAEDADEPRQAYIKGVMAHELFHTIQHSYDKSEASWLKEATAQWAVHETYPVLNFCTDLERRFFRYPHYSIQYHPKYAPPDPGGTTESSTPKISRAVRPYGTSAFFRFLGAHGGRGRSFLKTLWEKAAAQEGPNALEALGQALGDEGPLGDEFRRQFERFAVGALLLEQAPSDSRIVDPAKLRGSKKRIVPITSLSQAWAEHLQGGVSDADELGLRVRFGDAGGLPEARGRVGACGIRYFGIRPPPGTPKTAALDVSLEADPQEVALLGFTKRSGAWKVVRGRPHPASGSMRVRVPGFGQGPQAAAMLAVVRYGASPHGFETFPMRIAGLQPPHLTEFRVLQEGAERVRLAWSDAAGGAEPGGMRDAATPKNGALDPEAGPASIEMRFSEPVKAAEGAPLCSLGRDALSATKRGDGTLWVAEVPADVLQRSQKRTMVTVRAVSAGETSGGALALDEDPKTTAFFGWSAWEGYERSGNGSAFPVRVQKDAPPPVPGTKTTWSLSHVEVKTPRPNTKNEWDVARIEPKGTMRITAKKTTRIGTSEMNAEITVPEEIRFGDLVPFRKMDLAGFLEQPFSMRLKLDQTTSVSVPMLLIARLRSPHPLFPTIRERGGNAPDGSVIKEKFFPRAAQRALLIRWRKDRNAAALPELIEHVVMREATKRSQGKGTRLDLELELTIPAGTGFFRDGIPGRKGWSEIYEDKPGDMVVVIWFRGSSTREVRIHYRLDS